MRRRFDRPRNARWPILAILLALIAALFAPGIASAQPGRTYTIATDLTFAPFEFENEDGKLVGIDIDLLNAIAEDQGFKVDIKQLGFDAALQAVQAGQADGVIAGMSITDARKQVFDFSDPYFESGVQMAVLETDGALHPARLCVLRAAAGG
ncbi:transporter substrate-binding domain-containing protein, partial [Streptomyces sp. NPDC018347]|uniref:transporter substrate-binding domain-containing protein n=1 Tax=Streptomyces sp. NPDC018347 TaxID=3157193 RepID=UPI0033D3BD0B